MVLKQKLFYSFSRKQSGFTLIELLVVIAIIGVLAAVILVSMNTSRSKARDTRVIADIRQVTTALSLYYNDNNGYPGSNTTWYDINGHNAFWPDFSTIMPTSYMVLPAVTQTQLWYYRVDANTAWLAFIPQNVSLLSQDHDCYLPSAYYCIVVN